MNEPLNYARYLHLPELLQLQRPRSEGPEHDEMLFIIIHQVYELWFKEVLHEVDYVAGLLGAGDLPKAGHTLKRILTIMKVLVAQLDVLETMTPLEYLTFREQLEQGSGFQSYQFREFEMVLGFKREAIVEHFPQAEVQERLRARFEAPSAWDALLKCLAVSGIAVPEDQLNRDVTQGVEASEELQDVLMEVYRNHPRLTEILERFVDLDEGLMEWRYRHVKMVERTIGMKRGTGGSDGVPYLRGTLNEPVFPDLWVIRGRF
jgi:tryptophan 2,3-dioxygenase